MPTPSGCNASTPAPPVASRTPRSRCLWPTPPARGHALIDRALYLPKSWADDAERRAAAGVPDDVQFATKPALARELIVRALQGGAATSWVAGEEVWWCRIGKLIRKSHEVVESR